MAHIFGLTVGLMGQTEVLALEQLLDTFVETIADLRKTKFFLHSLFFKTF